MSNTQIVTGGTGYSDDALPLKDLQETPRIPFVIENGQVRLRGSKSRSSGSMAFPEREVCLESGKRDMEPFLFGPEGVLYSFTTIHLSSTRPTPYTLGYVDFPNGVRVLAHVHTEDGGPAIACDQPVALRADGDAWFVVPTAN